MNTNYCSLSEHLLVFFMDYYRTRALAEDKIINLLINLRYYHDHWGRAKQFTQNMGLTYMGPGSGGRDSQAELTGESQELDEHGDPKRF